MRKVKTVWIYLICYNFLFFARLCYSRNIYFFLVFLFFIFVCRIHGLPGDCLTVAIAFSRLFGWLFGVRFLLWRSFVFPLLKLFSLGGKHNWKVCHLYNVEYGMLREFSSTSFSIHTWEWKNNKNEKCPAIWCFYTSIKWYFCLLTKNDFLRFVWHFYGTVRLLLKFVRALHFSGHFAFSYCFASPSVASFQSTKCTSSRTSHFATQKFSLNTRIMRVASNFQTPNRTGKNSRYPRNS